MKRRIIKTGIAVIIVIAALLVSTLMIRNKPVPEIDLDRKEVLYVKTGIASTSEVRPEALFRGRVASMGNVVLSSEVNGRILEGDVPLKEGQSFRKGDVLLNIYDEDMKANLVAQRSSFLQLVGSVLPDIRIDYPEQFGKWKDFFNLIDIHATMPALPDIDSEQERVFVASRNILSQYYGIIQQEVQHSRYTVYAPFNGTYTRVNSEVGSVASMNMQIGTLIRTDVMEVVVPVLPEKLGWITKGQPVTLTRNNGQEVQGSISRIASFIDPTSQRVNIYVSVRNSQDRHLLEGEYVEATIISPDSLNGMIIPREALVGDNRIYVMENGMIAEREIHILDRMEDYYLIGGYTEGEEVVIESLVDVRPGQMAAPRS